MIKRNLLANYLGGAWTALMSVAFIPLYISFLGIEAFGVIGVFVALQGWFALLDMGLTPTINREMARFKAGQSSAQDTHDLLRSMELAFLGAAALIALILWSASPWLAMNWLSAKNLSIETIGQALQITGIVIGLRWFSTLYRGALLGLQKQVQLNALNAFFATIRGGGSVLALMAFGPTLEVFFWFQALLGLAETAIFHFAVQSHLPAPGRRPSFKFILLQKIGRFAGGMTMMTVLFTIMTQVDRVILVKFVDLDNFGYYTVAITASSVIMFLTLPVTNVTFPRFTTLRELDLYDELNSSYHKFCQLVSILVYPSAFVICLYSNELMFFWTRDAFMSAAVSPILSIFVLGTALHAAMHVPYSIQAAYGSVRATNIALSVVAIFMVLALILYVPQFGVLAAAWVWFGANAIYIIIAPPLIHRTMLRKEFWNWLKFDNALPAGAAFLGVALVRYGTSTVFDGLPYGSVLKAIVSGLVAMAFSVLCTEAGRQAVRQMAQKVHALRDIAE